MRPIDSEAWTLLVDAGKTYAGLPEELGRVLALPYADLISLPGIDDSEPNREGVRYLPEWEEHAVDATDLESLGDLIRQEPGGSDGVRRLESRRAALAPFVDQVLVRYVIRWDRFDASSEVEAPGRTLVHFEIRRRDG
jgi:hypothetical protein